jgi:Transposase DDE domain group 1
MQTECSADLFGFAPLDGRAVVAAFDGGKMTSDAGAMLLGATDRSIGLIARFAGCFTDHRSPDLIEHRVATLVGQRVFGIALGYEDLIDHDELRHDPVMAILAGKLAARRSDCAPLAGKSTLNRLELSRREPSRYHKISYDESKIEGLFVDVFSTRTPRRHNRSSSTSTPPTTRCTGIRKGASSTGITTATATCRFTSFAAGTCWRPNCARPTSMAAPAVSKSWRGSSPASASAGPGCASCCAPIRGLPAIL